MPHIRVQDTCWQFQEWNFTTIMTEYDTTATQPVSFLWLESQKLCLVYPRHWCFNVLRLVDSWWRRINWNSIVTTIATNFLFLKKSLPRLCIDS